ncbi:MAG TPA: shikimate dehydrogenase [Acidimicrobiales bacterium]|nr:shikimate dehydrogenase [Acidimicrobiales bacterium]
MPGPRGSTRLVAVIGDPVRHSLSPVMHNAAFRALDLDWVYVALQVARADIGTAIAGMRVLGLEGLSVTMPHKQSIGTHLDRLGPTAAHLGAVNTVVRTGGSLVGESTDGQGLLDALRDDEGFDPAGRRCLVLGAGGAARAAVLALAQAGASEVAVRARRASAAQAASQLAGSVGAVAPDSAEGDYDLVVNATPLGMAPADPLPADLDRLGPGQLVVDLVYHPATTPLVTGARARGATAVNGLGMLLHQAAHAFRLWTAEDPPLSVMSAAALAALAAAPPPVADTLKFPARDADT